MKTRPLAFAALAFAFTAQAQQPPQQQPPPRPPQYPQQQRAPQPGQPQSQAPQGAPTAPMASFGWFAELAGSCWKGSRAEGRSDVQCYQKQFNRFIRGSIKFYQADKVTGEADSVFGYDGNAKLIIYSQWGSNGSVGFGQATLQNDELVFQNHNPDNSEAPTRSVWRRIDADSFKIVRQRRSGEGAWTDESAVTYARVKPAS
jgi:hypothetical protein